MDFASLDDMFRHANRMVRHDRYNVTDFDIKVLARAKGMRFNCFWLKVLNLSQTGILVTDAKSNSVVTFRVGDELHVTLDMAGNLFRRPLHLFLKVAREDSYGEQMRSWGLVINEIEPRHKGAFDDGIVSLASIATVVV